MEEQQMEVDSGIEENEEQIVEMKREEDLPLPYSPFTSSYVVPNFSSRKSSEEISLWSQRKKELEYSLQNIQQIATQLVWLNSPTISLLQQELVSLANFYQFLLVKYFNFFFFSLYLFCFKKNLLGNESCYFLHRLGIFLCPSNRANNTHFFIFRLCFSLSLCSSM